MSRFLFVIPPLVGHINPTIAVGRELKNAQHDVAWVGHASVAQNLLPKDFIFIPADESKLYPIHENWMTKSKSVFGLESFKFFFQDFMFPLAHAMIESVEHAIKKFKPDLIICDQQALAGCVAAKRNKLPWITFASTPAGVFNPAEQFPKVKMWMNEKFEQFQKYYHLPLEERPDLSQQAVIIFSIRELVQQQNESPSHFYFVGPSCRTETNNLDFPWHELKKDTKKVYLSLGTLNAQRSVKFYEKVNAAFEHKNIQLIISAPPEMFAHVPSNFIVRKKVPQIELLKNMDAVIFHGGHNTFCEALLNGLPLVVAPIKDDQPVIAEQIVRNGVGIRVHFDRVKSADLFEATQKVLQETEFRSAAGKMQKLLNQSGGAAEAARLIIKLEQPLIGKIFTC